jgi:hypothetical protein
MTRDEYKFMLHNLLSATFFSSKEMSNPINRNKLTIRMSVNREGCDLRMMREMMA